MGPQDFFLKIDGIEGESMDTRHAREIQIDGWELANSNAMSLSGAGGGSGKVTFKDFRFYKPVDKASIPLFVACCQGTHLKSATLTCRRAGATPFEFLTVTLTNVVITSYDANAAAGGGTTLEQVTMGFTRIAFKYASQLPNGGAAPDVLGGWDVQTNTKV